MKQAQEFYDVFDKKLIRDYLFGNPRIEAAISFALQWVQTDASRVLDIGCGIGWSSMEIAKHFPNAAVLGVDLSPVLVETAGKLFRNDNLDYMNMDVTGTDFPENGPFDSIILLDVFEHIPQEARSTFYESLNRVLADNGRIILTCPSVFHQRYLREQKPDGLQPVDEDVDAGVLTDMAEKINGELRYYQYSQIWKKNDYLHAVVEKYDARRELSAAESQPVRVQLEKKGSRMKRVAREIPEIELPGGFRNRLRRIFSS